MPSVNVPNVGIVNFPDGMTPEDMQRAIETEIIPNAPKAAAAPVEQPASESDKILGSVPGRIALGASQLITGPLQLGANVGDWVAEKAGYEPTVGKAVNATLAVLEEKKKRGIKAHGTKGFD